MPIITPDVRDVELGRSRIEPADTYARPPDLDGGMTKNSMQVAEAFRSLGTTIESVFGSIGDREKAKQDQLDEQMVPYWADQIRADLKDGIAVEAQTNAFVGDKSPLVQARVNENIGRKDGADWASAKYEQFLSTDAWQDPLKTHQFIESMRQEAAGLAKGQPFYGGSFTTSVDGVAAQIQQHAQAQRAEWRTKEQVEGIKNEVLTRSTAAIQEHTPVNQPPNTTTMPDQYVKTNQGTFWGAGKSVDDLVKACNGKVIGESSQCVALVKEVTNVGHTSNWKPGAVIDAYTKPGTPIATFGADGKYKNTPGQSHAAIYLGPGSTPGSIKVLDQWKGQPAHVRDIKPGVGPEGAENFRVINGAGGPPAITRSPSYPVTHLSGNGAIDHVVNHIIGYESGGNPTAQNPRSSAGGLGQFIDSTWLQKVRQYYPSSIGKMSDGQILSLKKSTSPSGIAFQQDMVRRFTEENAQLVTKAGAEVTPGNIYLMHFAGPDGGRKILQAADQTRIESLLTPDAISANPHLRGMTVGEVKQWAARAMGQKVNPMLAAHNSVRMIDREWSKTSSIGNVMRREIYTKTLVDMAMKTGDESWLERMPPEYITPEVSAEFEHARKVARDVKWAEYERAYTMQKRAEQDVNDVMIENIQQKYARGEQINPAVDAMTPDGRINNAAFNYAKNIMNDVNIPTSDSMTNMENLKDTIETAAVAGKLKEQFGSDDPKDIRRAIDSRSDIRTEEKNALKKELDKILDLGVAVQKPDVKEAYNVNLASQMHLQDQSVLSKVSNTQNALSKSFIPPFSFVQEAQKIYDFEIRQGFKAYTETNGRLPQGVDKKTIIDTAVANTKKAMDERAKQLTEMFTAGGNKDKPEGKTTSSPQGRSTSDYEKQTGLTKTKTTYTTTTGKAFDLEVKDGMVVVKHSPKKK